MEYIRQKVITILDLQDENVTRNKKHLFNVNTVSERILDETEKVINETYAGLCFKGSENILHEILLT